MKVKYRHYAARCFCGFLWLPLVAIAAPPPQNASPVVANPLHAPRNSAEAAEARLRFWGQFTHAYTRAHEPVWRIEFEKDTCLVRHTAVADAGSPAQILDQKARRQFWDKMWWSGTGYQSASCLAYDQGAAIFCHIPPAIRRASPELKGYHSDYLHYDLMGGLMEVERLK